MNIDKVIVLLFKKDNALGNLVYTIKCGEEFMLPNTVTTLDSSMVKIDGYKLAQDYGFSLSKGVEVNLGTLLYNKMAFFGIAIMVEDAVETRNPEWVCEGKFEPTRVAKEKCASPFKEFLGKFSNFRVV